MDRRTRCAQGSRRAPDLGRPLSPVIVPAVAFELDDQAAADRIFAEGRGWVYARYANPTVSGTERFLAELEGAEDAALFASGMSAISTVMLTLSGSGRRVAAQRELYGGTVDLVARVLPALGLEVERIPRDELAAIKPERLAGCDLLLVETPVNPTLRLVDLRSVATAARAAGVPLVVDGTFATPILQQPLEHGADLVVHSATKYLGGHGDVVGGAVAGCRATIERIRVQRRALGGVMGPFDAFLLHRGMRTLALRMEACSRTAAALARALADDPRVGRVNYPGLPSHPDAGVFARQMEAGGGMLSFTVAGGPQAAERFHDRLRLFARAGTLGGVESLVSLPARMSHRSLTEDERVRDGVTGDLVRLSVGLESADDLLADLEQALAASAGA